MAKEDDWGTMKPAADGNEAVQHPLVGQWEVLGKCNTSFKYRT